MDGYSTFEHFDYEDDPSLIRRLFTDEEWAEVTRSTVAETATDASTGNSAT